jgi:hypothetical protein
MVQTFAFSQVRHHFRSAQRGRSPAAQRGTEEDHMQDETTYGASEIEKG